MSAKPGFREPAFALGPLARIFRAENFSRIQFGPSIAIRLVALQHQEGNRHQLSRHGDDRDAAVLAFGQPAKEGTDGTEMSEGVLGRLYLGRPPTDGLLLVPPVDHPNGGNFWLVIERVIGQRQNGKALAADLQNGLSGRAAHFTVQFSLRHVSSKNGRKETKK
jgi:hypothetical protein